MKLFQTTALVRLWSAQPVTLSTHGPSRLGDIRQLPRRTRRWLPRQPIARARLCRPPRVSSGLIHGISRDRQARTQMGELDLEGNAIPGGTGWLGSPADSLDPRLGTNATIRETDLACGSSLRTPSLTGSAPISSSQQGSSHHPRLRPHCHGGGCGKMCHAALAFEGGQLFFLFSALSFLLVAEWVVRGGNEKGYRVAPTLAFHGITRSLPLCSFHPTTAPFDETYVRRSCHWLTSSFIRWMA